MLRGVGKIATMNALGLSQRLAVVAVFLDDSSRRYTSWALSDLMGIPVMTVSHILREMVKQGLLISSSEKGPRPPGRRRKQYWMPPEAEAKIRAMHELEEAI